MIGCGAASFGKSSGWIRCTSMEVHMEIISIIIVANEDVQGLCTTIDALLRQTYGNLEILVVDRMDNTDTLESLALRYGMEPALRYVAMPAQSSYGVLVNAAVNMARGNYIAVENPTDVAHPEFCERAMRLMQRASSGWCYCAAQLSDTDLQMPPASWPAYKKQGFIFPDLLLCPQICSSAVVCSRKIFEQVGGYDEDLTNYSEYEFLLKLAHAAPAMYMDRPLVRLSKDPKPPLKETLLARCYVLSLYCHWIEKMQLKQELIEQLMWDIDQCGAAEEISCYTDILREDDGYRAAMDAYTQRYHPPRQMVLSQRDNVSGVANCIGCGSCVHHCPHQAIRMDYQEEGFLYPKVDEARCINCGLCLQVCPTQITLSTTPIPTRCYAVQASKSIRMQSSSGGVFTLLAQHILSQGGYVSGAVYDEKFHVRHIVGNQEKDMQAMRSSKYAQSDTREIYPQILALLESGKTVLFTGCACQIAGLRAFLKKSYDNLYTVDVICHGVPSPLVLESRLKEFTQEYGELAQVDFRNKSAIGWFGNLCLWFKNGTTYIPKQWDCYYTCFINNWILRESCYQCEFKGKKYSDLTMADFWGIQSLAPGFEDGAGTSYLTVNSAKGQQLFESILPHFEKCAQFGKEAIPVLEAANPNLRNSVARPAVRDYFFAQWKKTPDRLMLTLQKMYSKLHFDVGLVLFWGPNHGNALTNYALYRAVSDITSVLAIDNGISRPTGRFAAFAKKHYVRSSDYLPQRAFGMLSDICSTLVVGSDQTWNKRFARSLSAGKYFQLDFAKDSVRKIAYGASFGNIENAPPADGYKELYQRFDKIGMREQGGAELCKSRYGVQADFVLDPVFLLEPYEYEKLALQATAHEEEPFIFTYFLFPNEQTKKVCQTIQRKLGGIKMLHTTQGNWETRDDYRHLYQFDHFLHDVSVEDWLYYIRNAAYVITDSFHATCVSLFFHKKFMTIAHAVTDRFATLTQWSDVASHVGKSLTPEFIEQCLRPLDYATVDAILAKERQRCMTWLKSALKA